MAQPVVYARYLIPRLLPENIKRAIYMDQDMIVQKDIGELWSTDLEGYPVAAAREFAHHAHHAVRYSFHTHRAMPAVGPGRSRFSTADLSFLSLSPLQWRKQLKMGKEPLRGYDHDTCTLNNGMVAQFTLRSDG